MGRFAASLVTLLALLTAGWPTGACVLLGLAVWCAIGSARKAP